MTKSDDPFEAFAKRTYDMLKEEDRIKKLSEPQLLAEWKASDIESQVHDLLADEIERRNLDL